MKITIRGLEAEIPFDLQDTVYFQKGTKVVKGQIRRFKLEAFSNSGHRNLRVALTAVIFASGRENLVEFGCFARSWKAASTSATPRLIALYSRTGVFYPPVSNHKRRDEGMNWMP